MPRFHFNFSDGFSDADPEGHQLADVDAAKRAATGYLGQSLCDKPQEFWNDGQWSLTVTDDGGLTLFRVEALATDAPALQARPEPTPLPGA